MKALFSSAVLMTELWLRCTWGSLSEGITDPEAQWVQSILSGWPTFQGLKSDCVHSPFSFLTTLHMHRSPRFPSAAYPHEDQWPAVFSSS